MKVKTLLKTIVGDYEYEVYRYNSFGQRENCGGMTPAELGGYKVKSLECESMSDYGVPMYHIVIG